MRVRPLFVLLAVLVMLSCSAVSFGQLYGATGSNGVAGELFILDPATGAVLTDVGPLLLATGAPVGITGLAIDPGSGIMYGSTANASPSIAAHLVTIDPSTAIVTDVGAFGVGVSTLADLTWDATTGTLFGWQAASGHHLATVNTSTGAQTLFGPGTGDFGGGGIAADASGTLFITPDGATAAPGHISTVDTAGIITTGPLLSGHGFGNRDNALAFDPTGILYASDCNAGFPSVCNLVDINTSTGKITIHGPTPNNLDAIVFVPQAVPEPGTLALGAGFGLAGLLAIRRRRK